VVARVSKEAGKKQKQKQKRRFKKNGPTKRKKNDVRTGS
jgi:hypothetical protein